MLEAVRVRCPDDAVFIAAIGKDRADERNHYMMFRRWFELRCEMPLQVDRACGHIDRFVEVVFGRTIDELDTQAVIGSDALFERLCRVIMLTEMRGMRQVDTLLKSRLVRSDPVPVKIFRIVERGEPSHWQPYQEWLTRTGRPQAKWHERLTDFWIHRELLFIRLPMLFLNYGLPRRSDWADADEIATGRWNSSCRGTRIPTPDRTAGRTVRLRPTPNRPDRQGWIALDQNCKCLRD